MAETHFAAFLLKFCQTFRALSIEVSKNGKISPWSVITGERTFFFRTFPNSHNTPPAPCLEFSRRFLYQKRGEKKPNGYLKTEREKEESRMTEKELRVFRESLRCLTFQGISIKAFAEQIHIRPKTLYNYISGQRPSAKHYTYILYRIEKEYPAAFAQGQELAAWQSQEGL